jgi:hypothetical protein
MSNITDIEKRIVFMLAKLHTKKELQQDLSDNDYMKSNLAHSLLDRMGIDSIKYYRYAKMDISIEYAHYTILHYDKILKKEFPSEIERISKLTFEFGGTEWVRRRVWYTFEVYGLESLIPSMESEIDNSVWEFDPELQEVEDEETTDSDYDNIELHSVIKLPSSLTTIGGNTEEEN